jgi:hypothetical protein
MTTGNYRESKANTPGRRPKLLHPEEDKERGGTVTTGNYRKSRRADTSDERCDFTPTSTG